MMNLITEFCHYMASEKMRSMNTINSYRSDLENYVYFLENKLLIENIKHVKADDIKKYFAYMKKMGYTATSMSRELSSIRAFHKFLHLEGIVHENVALALASPKKDKKLPTVLSVEEVMKILKDKEKLLYVDDGCDEVVIKFEDLPDVIVDINTKSGMTDLKIYDYQNPSMTPLATTMGIFLDKCNPDLREKIIDRLVKLQQGEIEVKDYKMIDEYILEEARDKLEQEKKTKAKRNKEAR